MRSFRKLINARKLITSTGFEKNISCAEIRLVLEDPVDIPWGDYYLPVIILPERGLPIFRYEAQSEHIVTEIRFEKVKNVHCRTWLGNLIISVYEIGSDGSKLWSADSSHPIITNELNVHSLIMGIDKAFCTMIDNRKQNEPFSRAHFFYRKENASVATCFREHDFRHIKVWIGFLIEAMTKKRHRVRKVKTVVKDTRDIDVRSINEVNEEENKNEQ